MNKKAAVVLTAVVTFFATLLAVIFGMSLYNSSLISSLGIGLPGEYSETALKRAVDLVEAVYYEDVDKETLYKGALEGMMESLGDEYSWFVDEDAYEDLMSDITGEFSGIGVQVSIDPADNLITVISPIEDTPAYKAGIVSGDKIIAVDSVPVSLDNYRDAISMMRGTHENASAQVTVTVKRAETGSVEDLVLMREKIVIKNVKSRMLPSNVGYIRITNFEENTHTEFNEHLNLLGGQSLSGLVIDLRGNPGGIIDSTHKIADELLPEGLFLYFEYKDGTRQEFKCDSEQYDFPISVIINEGSASASEALAGAIQATGRGTLVGEKSFGKGIVQSVIPFMTTDEGTTAIYLTSSKYYTPNGKCIHGEGLTPDIEIALSEDVKNKAIDDMSLEEDVQLKAALEAITK